MYVRYIMLAMAGTVVYSYSMQEKEFGKIVSDLTQRTLDILAKKETIAKLKNSTHTEENKQKIASDIALLIQEVDALDTQFSGAIKQILQKAELNDLQKKALEDNYREISLHPEFENFVVVLPTDETKKASLEN